MRVCIPQWVVGKKTGANSRHWITSIFTWIFTIFLSVEFGHIVKIYPVPVGQRLYTQTGHWRHHSCWHWQPQHAVSQPWSEHSQHMYWRRVIISILNWWNWNVSSEYSHPPQYRPSVDRSEEPPPHNTPADFQQRYCGEYVFSWLCMTPFTAIFRIPLFFRQSRERRYWGEGSTVLWNKGNCDRWLMIDSHGLN